MRRICSLLLCTFFAFTAAGQSSGNSAGAFADVNGTKLYYQECGSGPKAVVLMHDGVANSAVFDPVWAKFCERGHTIRYDRRGYGHSPETKKPYYEADDLAALLLDRKITQAALVASSHGGQVAMEFSYRYPEKVSDLVVVGPGVSGFPYSENFLMREFANQTAKDRIEAKVQDKFLILPGHDSAKNKLREILKASPNDTDHNDMPLDEATTFPSVSKLHVPTLILIGSGDIADNHAVTGALAVTIPGAQRIVLDDAGHMPYLEHPQEFFDEVNKFLTLHGF